MWFTCLRGYVLRCVDKPWVACMGRSLSSPALAPILPVQQDQLSSWAELPAEVVQLVARLLPSADWWTLTSVASSWAVAVSSLPDVQLTLHSQLPKIKNKFALTRKLQTRYPQVQFVVKVHPPLSPLQCIYLLRTVKYQVSTTLFEP